MLPGQEMMRPDSFHLKPHQHDETRKRITGIELASHFNTSIGEPVLIDVKDAWTDKVLPGVGIAEQCARHDRIMQFLKSRWNELETGELDLYEVSELMGLRTLHLTMDLDAYNPPMSMKGEFDFVNPLVDFMSDMARGSKITIHPDGRLLLSGTGTEIKDILPIVAEFYLNNDSTTWERHSVLIPQFNRFDTYEAEFSSLNVQAVAVAPLNSPEKVKAKPLGKRRSGRRGVSREQDLYKRNYFHACESLLSLMMNKKHDGKVAILWLKKSGPELPELLTQFSASIAGTGLAVLFSVVCKVACGRVPLTSSKLLSTGLAFGLVWLSWAVNKLRDTIIHVSRNAGKGLKDEEVMRSVDRSLKDVYFRAATLLAVAVLRVA
ncbi:unnamed protein product [Linum tenue]|uniref:Uncharacterized protein n=1 Tax=Linum tenue TaxID=586396 RepID=A0AAV0IEZ5_9ROSI|nr:unnamed protein product [Linum tenue]